MKIKLVTHTIDPIGVMSDACGVCVGKYGRPGNLLKVRSVLHRGHLSIAEHVNFTFHISDVSRVLMAQLTRHRHVSFSIESQRSVTPDDIVIPSTIMSTPEAKDIFIKAYDDLKKAQDVLIKLGIPKEDVRYLSPEGSTTDIMLTCNLRALIEMSQKRLCRHAQTEIRIMFEDVVQIVSDNLGDWVHEFLHPACNSCSEKSCSVRDEYYRKVRFGGGS